MCIILLLLARSYHFNFGSKIIVINYYYLCFSQYTYTQYLGLRFVRRISRSRFRSYRSMAIHSENCLRISRWSDIRGLTPEYGLKHSRCISIIFKESTRHTYFSGFRVANILEIFL